MPNSSLAEQQRLRCPACRASQHWQDRCRRCNADLSLLVRAHRRLLCLRRRYRQALLTGETGQAARLLAEIRQLHPKTAHEMEQAEQQQCESKSKG
jgi:hypothetical protein